MRTVAALALLALMALIGCGRGSQYVGTWSGQAKPMKDSSGVSGLAADMLASRMKGTSTLTLKSDGTGYLKIAGLPEESVSWSADGNKLILQNRAIAAGSQGGLISISNVQVQSLVGTLAQDGYTLNLDLGQV